MKHTRTLQSLCLLSMVSLFAQALQAADADNFIEGDRFINRGIEYTVIDNLVATKSSVSGQRRSEQLAPQVSQRVDPDPSYNPNLPQAQTQSQSALVPPNTTNNIVERKGNMLIRFQSTTRATVQSSIGTTTTQSTVTTQPTTGLAVVRNERTGVLGVLLGNINVKMKGGYDPQVLADNYGVKLLGYAPGPRLAFLRVSGVPSVLTSTLAKLLADQSIERASIEILENPVVAQ